MEVGVMFRPHRGTLDEAMEEAVEYGSAQILKEMLDVNRDGISISYYGYDNNLHVDTYLVSNDRSGPLGFMWYIVTT